MHELGYEMDTAGVRVLKVPVKLQYMRAHALSKEMKLIDEHSPCVLVVTDPLDRYILTIVLGSVHGGRRSRTNCITTQHLQVPNVDQQFLCL